MILAFEDVHFTNTERPTKENICPDCGNEMKPEGGCWVCVYCGYSPCS